MPSYDPLPAAVREFLEAFEAVFGSDWKYTQEMLGIVNESPARAAAACDLNPEEIPIIARDGTFLEPGIDDEIENWGHRGLLLERYRRLKRLVEPYRPETRD